MPVRTSVPPPVPGAPTTAATPPADAPALREATRRNTRGPAAAARTAAELAALPAVIAGATVRIPRGVMLPEAVRIVDVLALRTDGDRPELIVGEVKTYPDRGGHTDAGELPPPGPRPAFTCMPSSSSSPLLG